MERALVKKNSGEIKLQQRVQDDIDVSLMLDLDSIRDTSCGKIECQTETLEEPYSCHRKPHIMLIDRCAVSSRCPADAK
jgi:hypothetical protein